MGAKAKMFQSLRTSNVAAVETSLDRALAIIQSTSASPSNSLSKGAPVVLSEQTRLSAEAAPRDDFLANAVNLSRKSDPIHLLSGGGAQPWELLPLKAAAGKVYPNIFNTSCMFFGSIHRDVLHQRPSCLMRPTRLGIDLAKIMRNLGVIAGFEIWQRPNLALRAELRWPAGAEPEDELFLRLFPQCYLKLHLRWDQHRPLWLAPDTPMTQQPLHTGEALPLSTANISKASRPVLMTREQLENARQAHPSGIFICYHDQLGLITDAVADLHELAAVLVLAHVRLPFSQAIQVRGALRVKYLRERDAGRRPLPLTKWNMLEQLRLSVHDRKAAMAASSVELETQQIKKELKGAADADAELIAASEAESERLSDELMGWVLSNQLPEARDVQQAFPITGITSRRPYQDAYVDRRDSDGGRRDSFARGDGSTAFPSVGSAEGRGSGVGTTGSAGSAGSAGVVGRDSPGRTSARGDNVGGDAGGSDRGGRTQRSAAGSSSPGGGSSSNSQPAAAAVRNDLGGAAEERGGVVAVADRAQAGAASPPPKMTNKRRTGPRKDRSGQAEGNDPPQ